MKLLTAPAMPMPAKPIRSDHEIRDCILSFAQKRGVDKSLCPSEVARDLQPENWRPLMADIRRVTASIVKDGLVVVTQFGIPVDALECKGHIRISLSRDPSGDDENLTQ